MLQRLSSIDGSQHARGASTIRLPTGGDAAASSCVGGGAMPAKCCPKNASPCLSASSLAALTTGLCLLPRTAKPC